MRYGQYQTEQIADIQNLFRDTFTDSEGEKEGQIIGKLAFEMLSTTPAKDLYCFIASDQQQLAGSIILSRLVFETGITAFILAPVAVATTYQKQGIGQQLIQFALDQLKNDDVELVVTYGDPRFYSKVGFKEVATNTIPAPFDLSMPEGWLALSLKEQQLPTITGSVSCVPALSKAEYW